MARLLIADAFPEARLHDLRSLGLEVLYQPDLGADTLASALVGVALLVVRSTKVTRKALEAADGLELIIRAGAGVDNIDVEAASERGILVANCPGKNADAVAELAMGLLLALDRRIVDATADLRKGEWNKKAYSKANGLKGSTLGVVGMGPIGRGVARRALGFEMNVLCHALDFTEADAKALGVLHAVTLREVAERADAISVHVPETPKTKKLFGEEFFAAMKHGAIFINTSRGGVVDQDALVAATKTKGLRVGLDVYAGEPSEGKVTWKTPVAESPVFAGTHHIGASTEQAQSAIAEETVRICDEFLRTGAAPNVVNVARHAGARHQLVVRHYDRVGVLAAVLGLIKKYEINVEEMSNTIFQGGKAAVASMRLSSPPPAALLTEMRGLRDQVIAVDVKG